MRNCIQMEKEYIPDKRRENIRLLPLFQAKVCANVVYGHEERNGPREHSLSEKNSSRSNILKVIFF